jgi:hypothetical protein
MPRSEPQPIVELRLIVVDPPADVAMCVQRGKDDFLPASSESARELTFDLQVRVGRRPTGEPNFLGAFAQGPADGRFIYLNSGTLAGQGDSRWSGRAKISLMSITWPQIEDAIARGAPLVGRIRGRSRDGRPTCASTPLLDGGWVRR